jgi:hypothetical protein
MNGRVSLSQRRQKSKSGLRMRPQRNLLDKQEKKKHKAALYRLASQAALMNPIFVRCPCPFEPDVKRLGDETVNSRLSRGRKGLDRFRFPGSWPCFGVGTPGIAGIGTGATLFGGATAGPHAPRTWQAGALLMEVGRCQQGCLNHAAGSLCCI